MPHRFVVPSASLLLALAACAPEFAPTLPTSVESFLSLTGWASEGAAPPPDVPEPDET